MSNEQILTFRRFIREKLKLPAVGAVISMTVVIAPLYLIFVKEWGWAALLSIFSLLYFYISFERRLVVWGVVGAILAFFHWSVPKLDLKEGDEVEFLLKVRDLRADSTAYYQKQFLEAELIELKLKGEKKLLNSTVIVARGKMKLATGEVIRGRGVVFFPMKPEIDGEFDYSAFLRRRGIVHGLRIEEFYETKKDNLYATFWGKIHRFRRKLSKKLTAGLKPYKLEVFGGEERLLAAMTLGMKDELGSWLRNIYKNSGMFHLFAVSGMHVGIVAICLLLFMRWLIIPIRWRYVVLPVAVIGYVVLVGAPDSAIRAGIMISIWSVGKLSMRPVNIWNTISASAVIILFFAPFSLFEAGFQYSFVAISSLVISMRICKKLRPVLLERYFLESEADKISYSGAILSGVVYWLVPSVILYTALAPLQLMYNQHFVPLMVIFCFPVAFLATLIMGLSMLKIFILLLLDRFVLLDGVIYWLLRFISSISQRVNNSSFSYRTGIITVEEILIGLFIIIMLYCLAVRFEKFKSAFITSLLVLTVLSFLRFNYSGSATSYIYNGGEANLVHDSFSRKMLIIKRDCEFRDLARWLKKKGAYKFTVVCQFADSMKVKKSLYRQFKVERWIDRY